MNPTKMKTSLLVTFLLFFGIVKPKAQVLLSGIYTEPTARSHEFFELNDTGNATTAFSLDNLAEPALTTHFFPHPANVLAVTPFTFQGSYNNHQVQLNWSVSQNEVIDRFELEKSRNGKDFTTAALILGSEKMGEENYIIREKNSSDQKIFYRLKVIDNTQQVEYSKVLEFETKPGQSMQAHVIVTNPVTDILTVSFASPVDQPATINVYDLGGRKILNQKINAYEGTNMINIPVSSILKKGMYVAEINAGTQRYASKFVKQ